MSDFFQKTIHLHEKHSEKGMGVGVLVTAMSGLELKTCTAMGRK